MQYTRISTRTVWLLLINITALIASSGCFGPKRPGKDVEHYQRSIDAIQTGDTNSALEHINIALTYNPATHYRAFKATLLYQDGKHNESRILFEKLIDDHHVPIAMRADILNNYACVLNQSGEVERAERMWQQLTQNLDYLTPEVAWFNLGMSAFVRSEYTRALHLFTQALTLESDYVDALFYRARAARELNKFTECAHDLKRVLTLSPEHYDARHMYNQLMRTGRA